MAVPVQGQGIRPPTPASADMKAAILRELARYTTGPGRVDWRTVNRLLDELAEVIGHRGDADPSAPSRY